MTVASQWVLILYFGYTSQTIGAYPKENDCDIAREMAVERWTAEFEGKPKGIRAVCLPVGEIVRTQ